MGNTTCQKRRPGMIWCWSWKIQHWILLFPSPFREFNYPSGVSIALLIVTHTWKCDRWISCHQPAFPGATTYYVSQDLMWDPEIDMYIMYIYMYRYDILTHTTMHILKAFKWQHHRDQMRSITHSSEDLGCYSLHSSRAWHLYNPFDSHTLPPLKHPFRPWSTQRNGTWP